MSPPGSSMSLTPRHDSFPKIFFKHQVRPNAKPAVLESISVTQQTAVITGGNAGIGLECGRLLLSRHLSYLILAVRSLERGEEAAAPLRKLHPGAKIDVWHLDLDSYDSIRKFARECADLPRLDIVILSAGIMNFEFKASSSTGHEEHVQVNYLSQALLALLLLPVLSKNKASGIPGRLTLVASAAGLVCDFPMQDNVPLLQTFDMKEVWGPSAAKARYDTTKGLVVMLAYKLSQITKADDTVVNSVDPSLVPGSSLFRHLPFYIKVFAGPIAMLLGTSVNNAAWRYIDAAVVRGEESHGSFFSDWETSPFHAFMYTEQGEKYMDRLWDETVKELDFPEVCEVLASLRGEPVAKRLAVT